jgi:hypothetical protein
MKNLKSYDPLVISDNENRNKLLVEICLFWCAITFTFVMVGCNPRPSQTSSKWTVPVGVDEVSEHIIQVVGIESRGTHGEEKNGDGLRMFFGSDSRRYQWENGKLLVRYVNGKMGHFEGGGQVHTPLLRDPYELDEDLRKCLDPSDDGKILKNFQAGKTKIESMKENGINVTK